MMGRESSRNSWSASAVSMVLQAMQGGGAFSVWKGVGYDCSRPAPVCPIRWFASKLAKKLASTAMMKAFHAHIVAACKIADAKPVPSGMQAPKVMVQLSSGTSVELTPSMREYIACCYLLRAVVKSGVLCKVSGALSKKFKKELQLEGKKGEADCAGYVAHVLATAESIGAGLEDVVIQEAFALEDSFFNAQDDGSTPMPKMAQVLPKFIAQCGGILMQANKGKQLWKTLQECQLVEKWFGSFRSKPVEAPEDEVEASAGASTEVSDEEKKAPENKMKPEALKPSAKEAQLALLGLVEGLLIHDDSTTNAPWCAPQDYYHAQSSIPFMHKFYSMLHYVAESLLMKGRIKPTHEAVRLFGVSEDVRTEIRAEIMQRQPNLHKALHDYMKKNGDEKVDYDFETTEDGQLARGVCVCVLPAYRTRVSCKRVACALCS